MAYQNYGNNRNNNNRNTNNRNNNYRNRDDNRRHNNNNRKPYIDRNELKKEYLRGVQETEALHKKSREVFLDSIRERATEIINDVYTLDEAQDKLEELIQFIDDYDRGEISAQELVETKEDEDSNFTLDMLQKKMDEIETDDIISLTEFVRDDF